MRILLLQWKTQGPGQRARHGYSTWVMPGTPDGCWFLKYLISTWYLGPLVSCHPWLRPQVSILASAHIVLKWFTAQWQIFDFYDNTMRSSGLAHIHTFGHGILSWHVFYGIELPFWKCFGLCCSSIPDFYKNTLSHLSICKRLLPLWPNLSKDDGRSTLPMITRLPRYHRQRVWIIGDK